MADYLLLMCALLPIALTSRAALGLGYFNTLSGTIRPAILVIAGCIILWVFVRVGADAGGPAVVQLFALLSLIQLQIALCLPWPAWLILQLVAAASVSLLMS